MKKGIVIGLFLGVLMTGLVFLVLNKKETINIKKEIVDEESMVTRVVEKATPSVVTVSISKTTVDPLSFLNQYFGNQNSGVGTTQKIEQDIGTGFIISSDGLIVTNKHVVADLSAKYKIVVGKDEILEVKNIYRDPLNDLAILKVEKNGLNAVTLGDSNKLKVGQSVIAIGTALGEFRSTVTKGVISGLGRGITAGMGTDLEKLEDVIQTDAAINPGNSGGPLFNSSGEVIGVNVAVSANGQNIGFAIPINLVKDSINNFRNTGEFERPYIGVAYKIISEQIALLNGVKAGAYVQAITENGPAAKAEIKVGDIIMEIDGQKLGENGNGDLINIINKKKIGDTVEVRIWRDKIEKIVTVTLEKKVN